MFIGKDKIEILANKDGDFVHDLSLKKGENVFSAIAVDSSGNESKNTREYIIIFDNEPPILEITKPENGQTFYGPKERQLIIEGVTEENCQVRVNGRVVVVESDGAFSFSTTLADGENMFEIKSQDEAENITESNISVVYEP